MDFFSLQILLITYVEDLSHTPLLPFHVLKENLFLYFFPPPPLHILIEKDISALSLTFSYL